MTTAIKTAVTYTGADSGALLIFDEITDTFSLGAMAPGKPTVRYQRSPFIDGLMRHIIATNKPYFVGDRTDPLAAEALRQLGRAKSLIAVPLDINGGQAGLLYVRGKRPHQFLEEHVTWMAQWARRTAEVLGRSGSLLNSIANVTTAIEAIDSLTIWRRICSEIKERFKFEFVSLHTVRRIEGIIETVCEIGGTEGQASVSKHSLCKDGDLRDIQAHIALSDPKRVEITSGWHDKFDKSRYTQYGHATYYRVWIPLVVLRDSKGRPVDLDWLDRWVPSNQSEKDREKGTGQSLIMEMQSPTSQMEECYLDTLGVLDAGFRTHEKPILKGVLYIHHRYRSYFREDEISWLTYYGNRVEQDIVHAIHKIVERESTQVAEVLSFLTTSLAQDPESAYLLNAIAHNTADMLAADVVVLVEYDTSNTNTVTDKAIAGQLRDPEEAVSCAFKDFDERPSTPFSPYFLGAASLPQHLQATEKLSCAMRLASALEMKVLVQSL